jgi:hypothetical protein
MVSESAEPRAAPSGDLLGDVGTRAYQARTNGLGMHDRRPIG